MPQNEIPEAIQQELEDARNRAEKLASELITREKKAIATELAGPNAPILEPHIQGIEFDEENGISYNGKTKEEFISEFKENKIFAPILNQASGAGIKGTKTVQSNDWDQYFDPSKPTYSTEKQYELQQSKPDLYNRLEKKYNLDNPFAVVEENHPITIK